MNPAEALAEIWRLGGGTPAAPANVRLTGSEPALPSSFAVGTLAQATIAASGLAAAEIWKARGGGDQTVAVDMRHAAIEFRSERYMRIDGEAPRTFDRLFGTYSTADGRHVRLHTNLPHHREGILKLLGAANDRDAVAAAVARWNGEALESEATAAGLVVALMRSPEEWAVHPHGRALAGTPPLSVERIGDAPPRPWPQDGRRPLEGIRVLDLTRIIAGPVCGRTLAGHGADVLLVTGPKLPSSLPLVMDTGRGKRSTHIDLAAPEGQRTLSALVRDADLFVQGYRPGAIAARGFAPERLAALSPGIVAVSLSAYGERGPWGGKRGFDSLVQTATGINHAEAVAAGFDGPKELPAQALDHASGYLMAAGALMALRRQRSEGGSWHVRVSLAATGQWLTRLGRIEGGLAAAEPTDGEIAARMQESASGFGRMLAVRHSAELSATPVHWQLPSVPLGSHPPAWAAG